MQKKEPRDAVLYIKVSKTNKKYVKNKYKKQGYSNMSEYVDDYITDLRKNKKCSE